MTNPFKDVKGKWTVNVNVLDSAKQEATVYAIPLTNRSDRLPFYQVMGVSIDAEPSATTIKDLQMWSFAMHAPKPIPRFIDGNASFVFCTTSAKDINKRIQQFGVKVKRTSLPEKIANWKELAALLQSDPEQFAPTH